MQILFLTLVLDRQTDQPTDIVTYRVNIAANNMTTTTTATKVTTNTKTTMTTRGALYCTMNLGVRVYRPTNQQTLLRLELLWQLKNSVVPNLFNHD